VSLDRWKPEVENHWLFLLSGSIWTAVGAMLCLFAYGWLTANPSTAGVVLALVGVVLAGAIYRLGFSRIAVRNIRRINLMPGRVCLFAFQEWRSYLVVGVMIGFGIALRSSAIPKLYLAPVYIGIGGGLLLASVHYYGELRQAVKDIIAR
jgi:hypothetical protein